MNGERGVCSTRLVSDGSRVRYTMDIPVCVSLHACRSLEALGAWPYLSIVLRLSRARERLSKDKTTDAFG